MTTLYPVVLDRQACDGELFEVNAVRGFSAVCFR